MKRAGAALVVVVVLAMGGPAVAQRCAPAVKPVQTLLLPFFEVDLRKLKGDLPVPEGFGWIELGTLVEGDETFSFVEVAHTIESGRRRERTPGTVLDCER